MPRYHFHVHNRVEAFDNEGIELPDLEAAKLSAVRAVRALMIDDIKKMGGFRLSDSIEIANPDGLQLHVMRYDEAVSILP